MRSLLLSALMSLSLMACSYQPEDPGQCKLTCSKAIIGGNDNVLKITNKSVSTQTTCSPDGVGKTIGPYKALFLVGEDILDETKTVIGVRPVPSVSIQPILIGSRPELQNENDADIQYRGLYTLKDNWCSDACGVVELDVASVCPGVDDQNDLTVQVHSGALFSDAATFPITTKAPETTTLKGQTPAPNQGK